MRRLVSIVAAAAVCAALATSCNQGPKPLTIVHFNDTHSHFEPLRDGAQKGMGGVIERAAFIDSIRVANGPENVLLLHAGDFSQGSSYFTTLEGDLEIATINAMGYDCVILGNHEFDNGLEELNRRLSMLQCPVVCSNYDFSAFEVGKIIKPYAVLQKAGLKIGIFSLLTDVSRMVDASVSSKMTHLDNVETAQHWADYLRDEEHCDLVVALNHIGFEDDTFIDPQLASLTRGIDLIIGGHSHTFLEDIEYRDNLDGVPVPIVQNGCWGLYDAVLTYVKPKPAR